MAVLPFPPFEDGHLLDTRYDDDEYQVVEKQMRVLEWLEQARAMPHAVPWRGLLEWMLYNSGWLNQSVYAADHGRGATPLVLLFAFWVSLECDEEVQAYACLGDTPAEFLVRESVRADGMAVREIVDFLDCLRVRAWLLFENEAERACCRWVCRDLLPKQILQGCMLAGEIEADVEAAAALCARCVPLMRDVLIFDVITADVADGVAWVAETPVAGLSTSVHAARLRLQEWMQMRISEIEMQSGIGSRHVVYKYAQEIAARLKVVVCDREIMQASNFFGDNWRSILLNMHGGVFASFWLTVQFTHDYRIYDAMHEHVAGGVGEYRTIRQILQHDARPFCADERIMQSALWLGLARIALCKDGIGFVISDSAEAEEVVAKTGNRLEDDELEWFNVCFFSALADAMFVDSSAGWDLLGRSRMPLIVLACGEWFVLRPFSNYAGVLRLSCGEHVEDALVVWAWCVIHLGNLYAADGYFLRVDATVESDGLLCLSPRLLSLFSDEAECDAFGGVHGSKRARAVQFI